MNIEKAIASLNVKERVDLAAKLTHATMSSFQHNTESGIAFGELSEISKNTMYVFSLILEKVLAGRLS